MTPVTKKPLAKPVLHKAAAKTVKPVVKATPEVVSAAPAMKEGRYYQGLGGRKTATAQVRLHPKQTGITINNKAFIDYFKSPKDQLTVMSPLELTSMSKAVGVTVRVAGGGTHAQAGAVRHGIAMALVALDKELKKRLKRAGFITRDPRVVERKKYGLKKARRAPQWAKR